MKVITAILLTLLLIFVFSLTQTVLLYVFYKTEVIPESFQKHFGIINVISYLTAYFVIFKIFWRPKQIFKEVLNSNDFEMKFLPCLIFIAIGLQLLDRPFWHLVPDWNYLDDLRLKTDKIYSDGFSLSYFYSALSTLIIAPVFEELLFRKFLLKKLLQNNSQKVGILISSLCFAIIHIETPSNLVPTFIFGTISSLIFINTKHIGNSIILHFLFNLFLEISFVVGLSLNEWFLDLNFNFMYWMLFLIGAGITFFATKKLLQQNPKTY